MRIFPLAAISTALSITNTLAHRPTQDRMFSLEYSTLLKLIKSQDETVKLKAASFLQTEQAGTITMKCMRSSQDPVFMLYAAGILRNCLRGAIGTSNVIKAYEKKHKIKTCKKEHPTDIKAEIETCEKEDLADMEAEISKWSNLEASPTEIWLLYRFMKTPEERHPYFNGRYHLNAYWTSRIYFTREIGGAVMNFILGMELEWDQSSAIIFGPTIRQSTGIDIKMKEAKAGPKERLQSLLDMDFEDWGGIRTETISAILRGTLGFTLHQADKLSEIFADGLDVLDLDEKYPWPLESLKDIDPRVLPPHSAIPTSFGFGELHLDQKVALRQLALVVKTEWNAFKDIIIDPGYL
ncbi:hypothetical protein FRB93_000507 [Tulasnella sp. JGI-2019a]|nr:hypothetical protein FRB93_000507 [Tulasnella sp. JGI-2019a]